MSGRRDARCRHALQPVDMSALTEYLRFTVTLIAVVDPFLAVPFFLTFTSGQSAADRARLASAIALTVFLILASSALMGELLLTLVGASLPAFQAAGGLVLLLMSLAMLNAEAGNMRQSQAEAVELESGGLSGIVPLAIPLLAGPGAISTTIIATKDKVLLHQLAIVMCIAIVCLAAWIVLRHASAIAVRCNVTGLNIGTRILGLLLAAMAMQTIAGGLKGLFPGLA